MSPKIKRYLITSLVILIGLVIAIAAFQGAGKRGAATPTTGPQASRVKESDGHATPPTEPAVGEAGEADVSAAPPPGGESQKAEAEADALTAVAPPEAAQAAPLATDLHFREQPEDVLLPLGDLDDAANLSRLRLDFSPYGAGLAQVTLADYYHNRIHDPNDRYTLMDGQWDRRPVLGLRRLYIDGKRLDPYDEMAPTQPRRFRQVAPGSFEAVVVDNDDQPVLTITRQYELGDVEGKITVRQQVRNETTKALSVKVEQWGPGDLPYSHDGYGDFRRVRFGYLDPRSAEVVLATDGDFLLARKEVVKKAADTNNQVVWPNPTSVEKKYTLAWVATTNRYFGFAVHRAVDDPQASTARALDQVDRVEVWLESHGEAMLSLIPKDQLDSRFVSLKLVGSEMSLAPGQSRRLDLGVYAGALRSSLLSEEQPYRAFSLSELIVYQLTCAFCTFPWLTHLLLWFLRLIEGGILPFGIGVHDWAISIIILVILVRLLLHPLTKKGQISLQRLSRSMQKLQPEIKKLQEKYKDNPKKLQQEQAALYREHNVNPAGCLGMLPMFLQTPIWIALYAMLYFAIELRQQPGFYGVFQMFGNWSFLADLSQPDHFFEFTNKFIIPGLGWGVSGINLLPLLMGVIFYLQQKYLTPPNPNMTPEQESQQKIMKIVFPLVFPLMLYSAPSGLTLYIMTSSMLGILESRYIRAHIDALDLDKDSKPTGTRATKQVTNHAEKFRKER